MRKTLRLLPVFLLCLAVVAWPQAAPQHSATLTWTASTTPAVNYNAYRSTVSGGPYTKINAAPIAGVTFTDTSVVSGTSYFYVVTAVDANGFESVNSNEAGPVLIPGNPLPPSGLKVAGSK